ncbi:hypothetical protein BDP81DRAFT_418127 [Colletotrichum phormii]|uniref:Uncharacterized protein n=1 Tax=Colletotrichum phormii TaxID=359342 RepID=A0AAJ0A2X6_9PEZI|nr:uncharacterized protein BDP81DRAFT_418127 [Colletotrichum phormii]KAK1641132.1 hypothetical protein BDP81DRAFT_418127 [Colletotrichum phormii]
MTSNFQGEDAASYWGEKGQEPGWGCSHPGIRGATKVPKACIRFMWSEFCASDLDVVNCRGVRIPHPHCFTRRVWAPCNSRRLGPDNRLFESGLGGLRGGGSMACRAIELPSPGMVEHCDVGTWPVDGKSTRREAGQTMTEGLCLVVSAFASAS